MKRSKPNLQTCLTILLLWALITSCSSKQDETNFRNYLNQDTGIQGKAGVLLTALGQPEDYEYGFYDRYLNLIFNSAFPPILKFIILRDSGTVLRDPDNLMAAEEYKPKKLMDCYGKINNEQGVPYAELEVEWVKPRGEGKAGHFLWKEKNGFVDIAEKSAIKVAAAYYSKMPGNKVPYRVQHHALFDNVKALLGKQYPGMPVRTAWDMYPESIKKALDELIKEKVETIVVCDLFPVYSSLEEFNSLFVEIDHLVAGRAKVVYTPYVGAYESFRKAYVKMAEDEIAKLPGQQKKLLVLTRHGMPEIQGEPFHKLSQVYYRNLKKEIEQAVAKTNTNVIFSDIEFASEEDDPDNERLSSAEAVEKGLEKKYASMIFILVDFMTENTDTVFCVRNEALEPLDFAYEGEVPYADFSQPFRTELTKDKTKFIVAGTPVGERYRPLVAQGIFDTLNTVLSEKKWPQLVLKEEKMERAVF